jgi:hypothetical protein
LLLEYNADVNALGENDLRLSVSFTKISMRGGRYGTALQAASNVGNVEIVKLVLNERADVNALGENDLRLSVRFTQI